MASPQLFTLPDGRQVEYLVSGKDNDNNSPPPLLFLHGTPGSVIPNPSMAAVCARKGQRLITVSRAGYGQSSRRPKPPGEEGSSSKRVVDSVADLQALLEHLGVDECVVAGWSGGGPHAIACAAKLPACKAALAIAGVGPSDAEDLDFIEGQGEDNIQEFDAARQGEEALQKFCHEQRMMMLQADAKGLTEGMATILSEVDKKAMLQDKVLGQWLVDLLQHGLRDSADGWVDDDLEMLRPWGFELGQVKVPVLVYQGKEDMMVPFSHGEWLVKHLPKDKVRPRLLEKEGHISVFLGRMDEMLDGLVAAASTD